MSNLPGNFNKMSKIKNGINLLFFKVLSTVKAGLNMF